MFRTVNLLMALSFGQARAQLLHRTKATEPRPCFDLPLFLLFLVILVGQFGGEMIVDGKRILFASIRKTTLNSLGCGGG
jgi:hypothetical protein